MEVTNFLRVPRILEHRAISKLEVRAAQDATAVGQVIDGSQEVNVVEGR